MKTLLLITVTLFIAAAHPAHAIDTIFKATVTGTVQTQILNSPTTGRIHTALLNNKRIFEEYQVSKSDYELVLFFINGTELQLLPKHTSAGLPTITVFRVGSISGTVVNTTARVINIIGNTASIGATNLFQDFTGEFSGTARYKGTIQTGAVSKFSCNMTATGTDQSNGGSGYALLKFKVHTTGLFTQCAVAFTRGELPQPRARSPSLSCSDLAPFRGVRVSWARGQSATRSPVAPNLGAATQA